MFTRAYRLAMSYKRVATVADLVRFGASLRIDCTACNAHHTLSRRDVLRLR